MIAYRNSQTGYLIISLLVIGIIATLASTTLETIGLVHYMALLLLIMALVMFYKLTVVVERGVIVCSFGQGVFSKTIRVREIAGCRVIRVPWHYGWGIRLTPAGWMYNIAGTEVVEITYKSGKKFLIGSNEAESLREAIEDEMKKFS
ncbi:MAG TPA: hypothetical protein PK843_17620 [bacterium]|nr:hypothetical protein [bacterium]